jgi:enoyl-CoA hydratase/carnithine racemase
MSTNELVTSSLVEGLGHIVLNRPAAYNALNTTMVTAISTTLRAWEPERLDAVVIRSDAVKAFCAGGDIKNIRQQSVDGDVSMIEDFFAHEYALNAYIATYPKPVISLINGLCMGGGMGLAIHGRFRVVSERATLAMPETAIGFFPDVGASYFLPRLPGSLGMYLGLTGHQMDYRDALYCGLATHYVPSDIIDTVPDVLAEGRGTPVTTVLAALNTTRPEAGGHLADHRSEIDWCFGAPTLGDIETRLVTIDTRWSRSVMEKMRSLSPQSLEIPVPLLRWGGQRSLAECLQTELRMTRIITGSKDFIEGVRAVLVDKDRNPSWVKNTTRSLDRLLEPMQA